MEHAGRAIQSDANNTDDVRMLGMVHDTGLIGIGTMKKSGKWSCDLYTTDTVRDHARELIDMCDLVDGKVTLDELRARQAQESLEDALTNGPSDEGE